MGLPRSLTAPILRHNLFGVLVPLGKGHPPQEPLIMPKQYFHVFDNQRLGPFSGVQIKQRAATGEILPHHRIQEEGSPKLYEARLVPGLFDTQASPPAAAKGQQSAMGTAATVPMPAIGGENRQQPGPLRPRFRNPISSLLNSLTTITLESMHSRVSRGELSQAAFEQSGAVLLTELQSAITFAESLPDASRPAGANTADKPQSGEAQQRAAEPGRTGGRPLTGTVIPPAPGEGRRGERKPPPRQPAVGSPATAASPVGASALQLGAAALAGGAWGYLLARQGGVGQGMAYGHGMGDTHIHYHGTASEFAADSANDMATEDHVPVSYEQSSTDSQAHVMGVDSNNDGLVDTFYGDSDGDGMADVMGRDTDSDGDLDHIAIDSNNDRTFDRSFTEDDAVAESDDIGESVEDDLDDQGLESDDDAADGDYDDGDYGDIADAGGDFGGDFDFG
jgi:hypothetical protein